jgi:hypothetical protein
MRFLPIAAASIAVIAPVLADDITATKSANAIEFNDGSKQITRYHIGPDVAKPYLWPLNAPNELAVTRAWPMKKGNAGETTDHVHQKSAWFCHGDLIPEGLELKTKSSDPHVRGVDFWSEAKGHGVIVCVEVGEPKTVGGTASVLTKNEWRSADGDKILFETRTLSVSKTKEGYLIAFDIDLQAGAYSLTFGDTKEGSMGVRVPDGFRTLLKDGGTIQSSDRKAVAAGTKGELVVWGQIADWNDYSGKVGDSDAGIAIFAASKNPYPSAWHTRDYGLMAANPFGRAKSGFPSQKGKADLVKLTKGEHLVLRYAIYTHTGDTQAGGVREAYQLFEGEK